MEFEHGVLSALSQRRAQLSDASKKVFLTVIDVNEEKTHDIHKRTLADARTRELSQIKVVLLLFFFSSRLSF